MLFSQAATTKKVNFLFDLFCRTITLSKPQIWGKYRGDNRVQYTRSVIKTTHQQFSFLIADKSDCFDRAITISSVRRAIVSHCTNTVYHLFRNWTLVYAHERPRISIFPTRQQSAGAAVDWKQCTIVALSRAKTGSGGDAVCGSAVRDDTRLITDELR